MGHCFFNRAFVVADSHICNDNSLYSLSMLYNYTTDLKIFPHRHFFLLPAAKEINTGDFPVSFPPPLSSTGNLQTFCHLEFEIFNVINERLWHVDAWRLFANNFCNSYFFRIRRNRRIYGKKKKNCRTSLWRQQQQPVD